MSDFYHEYAYIDHNFYLPEQSTLVTQTTGANYPKRVYASEKQDCSGVIEIG